ncbi:peptidylprolyl isomerase [Vulgatibacter sp.]|uniref:FKBP-type peptidyl-prolyl cis-trans isomerase n=1 Tax=Vulgatibacter sp. TaxID=1971226 RepID=UPI00356991CC
MKATKGNVVTVQYTLTDSKGEVLESSVGDAPLQYLHGFDEIAEGLENVLQDKEKGFKTKVTLKAADAYGERDDEMVIEVPRSDLPEDVEEGEEIWSDDEEGEPQGFTVMKLTDETATLDGNHPYAGKDITFDVELLDVRAATAEELEHGHAHGEEEECE